MKPKEIADALADHARWLRRKGGKRADLRGADLYGAYLCAATVRGAYWCSATVPGADLYGANLRGAKIGTGQTVISILRRATRSDGYEFFLWRCKEGFYVEAGCRFFSYAESRQHWDVRRVGEPLGDETQDILDMFQKAIERQMQS